MDRRLAVDAVERRDGERAWAALVVDLGGEGVVAQGEPLVEEGVEGAAGVGGEGGGLGWVGGGRLGRRALVWSPSNMHAATP